MEKQITKLIHQIKSDYGNDAYVGLTGDRRFENVSPNLCRLWGSIEKMSIGSLDTYYYRVFRKIFQMVFELIRKMLF